MAKTQASPKPQTKPNAPARSKGSKSAKARAKADAKPKATSKAAARATAASASPAAGATKLQTIVDLLSRPHGANIDELMAATGWQAHSVRGALAGSLKKKGIAVTSAKVDDCRRYSIVKSGRA